MNENEQIIHYEIQREQVAQVIHPLSESEINSGLEGIKRYKKPMEEMTANASEVKSALLALKRNVGTANAAKLSRPSLCSAFINGASLQPLESAKKMLNSGDLFSYVVLYDFGMGIRATAAEIVVAESAIKEGPETIAGETLKDIAELKGFELNVGVEAEAFISMQQAAKTRSYLLIKDPSGMELIDEFISGLEVAYHKTPKSYSRYIFDFLIEGAKTAREIYKSVYPLTENL